MPQAQGGMLALASRGAVACAAAVCKGQGQAQGSGACARSAGRGRGFALASPGAAAAAAAAGGKHKMQARGSGAGAALAGLACLPWPAEELRHVGGKGTDQEAAQAENASVLPSMPGRVGLRDCRGLWEGTVRPRRPSQSSPLAETDRGEVHDARSFGVMGISCIAHDRSTGTSICTYYKRFTLGQPGLQSQ